MIQTYEYRVPLDGKPFSEISEIIEPHAAGLIRIRPWLLACTLVQDGTWLHVTLRMTDTHTSRMSVNGRKAILAMTARARLDPHSVTLRQVLTEPNGRSFITGQGRTPRPRRPRSTLRPA
jgi:hypothetical protein